MSTEPSNKRIKHRESMTMVAAELLNTAGMRCPEPILKIATKVVEMKPEDILEVTGDCPTFEDDVRDWCKRLRKKIIAVRNEKGLRKKIWIKI
jgi:tRNA 2-thiouridine synthesizing protein A